jgi:hypothetical protein
VSTPSDAITTDAPAPPVNGDGSASGSALPDVVAVLLGVAPLRDGSAQITIRLDVARGLGRALLGNADRAHQGLVEAIRELLLASEPCAGWKGARAHLAALVAERERLRQAETALEEELGRLAAAEKFEGLDAPTSKLGRLRARLDLLDSVIGATNRECDRKARAVADEAKRLAARERDRVVAECDSASVADPGLLEVARGLAERLVPLKALRAALSGWNWAPGTGERLALEVLGAPPPPPEAPPPPAPPPARHPFAPPEGDVELTVISPMTRETAR